MTASYPVDWKFRDMKSYAAQSDITAINLVSHSITHESCIEALATNHLTSKRALNLKCLTVSSYTTLIDDSFVLKLKLDDTLKHC